MNRFARAFAPLALAFAAAATPAQAAIPVYPDGGTENPVLYSFTATATGNLFAYYAGSTASFTNVLGLSVNGGAVQFSTLQSNGSVEGDAYDFGVVTLGDILTFAIDVGGGQYSWFSNKALNSDGSNHIWSTAYAGGDYGIPAGTFVTFEDLDTNEGTDFNYGDIGFVFTNVTPVATNAVPEPATWAMMIVGFGLTGAALRNRRRRTLSFQ